MPDAMTLGGNGVLAIGYGVRLTGNCFQDFAKHADLFEQYRITKFQFVMEYVQNSASDGANAAYPCTGVTPRILDAIVPDNSFPPEEECTILSRHGVRHHVAQIGYPCVRTWRPKVGKLIYQQSDRPEPAPYISGVQTGGPTEWIDTTYLDIPHFGLVGWIDNLYGHTGTGQSFRIHAIAQVEFRNPR